MRQKPDFICIGPTRTATTWLYSHLIEYPEIDIPIKEAYFFWGLETEGHPVIKIRPLLKDLQKVARKQCLTGQWIHLPAERYNNFSRLRWKFNYLIGRRSPEWYANLFQSGAISGDLNAMLYLLTPPQIARLANALPELRVILHLRDPVERIWSNMSMMQNNMGAHLADGQMPYALRWNVNALPSHCELLERWYAAFPQEQILINWYDEIAESPATIFQRTAKFVGLNINNIKIESFQARINKTHKASMPDSVRRSLIESYKDDIFRLSEVRSEPYPLRWLENYQAFLDELK